MLKHVLALILLSPVAHAGDLTGTCADDDHAQFIEAKVFARAQNGLYMSDANAVQWALAFNQTHKCGTIVTFEARYHALYSYATDYLGLGNLFDASDVRSYAFRFVEDKSVDTVNAWKRTFPVIKNFLGHYLFNNDHNATEGAKDWNEQNCGPAAAVQAIQAKYVSEYNFANSDQGLNYGPEAAKQYALAKVRPMTSCPDILR